MFDDKLNKYIGYVYIFTNNINNKVYIGQTSVSLEARYKQHMYYSKTKSTYFYDAIKKYGIDNFKFECLKELKCDTLQELSKQLDEWEIFYISHYKSNNKSFGYNLTKGGTNTYKQSTKQQSIRVYQYDKYGNFVASYPSVSKAGAQFCSNGCGSILRVLDKNSLSYGFYWCTDNKFKFDLINYKQNKIIHKYDVNGNYISTYYNYAECAESEGKSKHHGRYVKMQCTGELKIPVLGHVWRYDEDSFDKYEVISPNYTTSNNVDIYDLYGNYINTYPSIKEALRKLNLNQDMCSTVTKALKGKLYKVSNYIWRYTGDDINKYKIFSSSLKPINIYDEDFTYVDTFMSVSLANKITNIDSGIIIRNCKNKPKLYHGYYWFYADSDSQFDSSKNIKNLSIEQQNKIYISNLKAIS